MTTKKQSLAEKAKTAVANAYRKLGGKNANPIFTDEMFDLLQEQEPHADDPLCLFHYFGLPVGDWYVFGADRMGPHAINMFTGESAEGHIQFWAFANLGDPACAEAGIVPLDKASGMGLRDIRSYPGMAGVELDRHYSPERLSSVMRRITGQRDSASEVAEQDESSDV